MSAGVGGWNAQAPLADMPETDAVILDNFIPRPGYVECRRGCLGWSTGYGAAVQSLIAYRGGATDKLFAASGSSIYNATSSGAIGAAVYTGLSTARVQYINFSNTAGNYIICVTGGDTPFKYDGTTWSTTAITGPSSSSTLVDVMVHKRRLWFYEANTLKAWYLPTDAIAGAATQLDLGPLASKGGVIAGHQTWTLDGGNGPDDYAIWVTTQGQVIVYKGTDPSSASTWGLVGVFDLGKPLGRRSLISYGAELVLLTADGVIPLSQALALNRAQSGNVALTAKIQNAFAAAVQSYGSNTGWEAFLYPGGQLAIYNVPVTTLGVSYQYVQNVQTGAWCRFTGLNAFCWAYANGTPYFGGTSKVYQWDTGSSDDGTAITFDIKGAFSAYGRRTGMKHFKMIRPIIQAATNVMPALDILTDYRDGTPSNVQTVTVATSSGTWGAGLWNSALWAQEAGIRIDWTSVTGLGFVGAPRLRLVTNPPLTSGVYPELPCKLIGFDLMFEEGLGL